MCDIYWARVGALAERHLDLLSPTEHARRQACRHVADRDRFTLAAVLLRLVIADRSGVPAPSVRVDRTCPSCGQPHGRPRVPGAGAELSITHSGCVAGVAVSAGAPVGLDVESLRPLDYRSLLHDLCAPSEREAVRGREEFFVCWTRKESVVKALGVGLTVSLAEVLVSAPRCPPRLIAYQGRTPPEAVVRDVSPGEGYVGAVTVLGSGTVTIREHAADDLVIAG